MMICVIALSYSNVAMISYFKSTKMLQHSRYFREIIGKIDFIQTKHRSKYIRMSEIRNAQLDMINMIVRTHIDSKIAPGDIIKVSGYLSPPSLPVSPYAYNFRRISYFNNISAIGFATTKMKLVSKSQHSSFFECIEQIREKIYKQLKSNIKSPENEIASALFIGARSNIDKITLNNVRAAGLAHLIAISGLHISIVTFICFGLIRNTLSLFPTIALQYNIKKIAAPFGIIAGYLYLILANAPVSAERAFIMVTLMFMAILLDRDPISMNSVGFAASFILFTKPISLLTPSFQMSFSAVIGLVSAFKLLPRMNFVFSIIASSCIATIAVMPYTIYHFNCISTWGLISNIIAIPLTTLIILPFGVLVLVLMPLNLDHQSLYYIIQTAIHAIILISRKIAYLPYSTILIHQFPTYVLITLAIGMNLFFIIKNKYRFLGIPIVIFGITLVIYITTPNILIHKKHFAFKGRDGNLYFPKKYRKNFVTETWLRQNAQRKHLTLKDYPFNDIHCDKLQCKYSVNGANRIIYLL